MLSIISNLFPGSDALLPRTTCKNVIKFRVELL